MKSKAKRRRGRPSRSEATGKALAGIDLTQVNPRQVLMQIAADSSAPSTARVAACRALLSQPDPDSGKSATENENDPVTALALKLLRRKR